MQNNSKKQQLQIQQQQQQQQMLKKNYKINNTNLEDHINKIQELVNVSRNIYDFLYDFY